MCKYGQLGMCIDDTEGELSQNKQIGGDLWV